MHPKVTFKWVCMHVSWGVWGYGCVFMCVCRDGESLPKKVDLCHMAQLTWCPGSTNLRVGVSWATWHFFFNCPGLQNPKCFFQDIPVIICLTHYSFNPNAQQPEKTLPMGTRWPWVKSGSTNLSLPYYFALFDVMSLFGVFCKTFQSRLLFVPFGTLFSAVSGIF